MEKRELDVSLPFLEHMGARLVDLGEGRARVGLDIEAWHLQHLGFVHGGVISTLSDNTGGTPPCRSCPPAARASPRRSRSTT